MALASQVLFWFLPWYLRRYTPFIWPVVDLIKTIGLGIVTAFLLILWDWARTSPVAIKSPSASPVLEDDLPDSSPLA